MVSIYAASVREAWREKEDALSKMAETAKMVQADPFLLQCARRYFPRFNYIGFPNNARNPTHVKADILVCLKHPGVRIADTGRLSKCSKSLIQ